MTVTKAAPDGPPPVPLPTRVSLPETLSYRLKKRLLGPPLTTEELPNERLGKGVALGVLAPDCISSSAYGSEEMLRILVPFVGVAAFTLLIPVTVAILVVLVLVTLSYREVVMVYTRAGGSYVVARDNFGPGVAQIAAVALLIDYTVTVAVQTAAGTAALVSAVPVLVPYIVPMTCAAVVLLCYANLRGLREAGRTFAFPTYFFVASMTVVIVAGLVRAALGQLPSHGLNHAGVIPVGRPGQGWLMGASVFIILKAFANGGSSLTGLEAISNGVGAFKPPEGRNARRTLVTMSITLGLLVLGVSVLARLTHAVPYLSGAPTVISQEAKFIFGGGVVGTTAYFVVQAATMLILFTGANTSFNGFPFLASFVAEDSFLPRQLTHRGHRLTFSNGIMVLTAVSVTLLLVTRAKVDSLVAVYAIGVFTGFTMAGAGMVRHHLRNKAARWRHKVAINGVAAALSGSVVVIFAVTKFTEGAWVVVILFPLLVWALVRLNRQYRTEAAALGTVSPRFHETPDFRRHIVLVLVDGLDLAVLRALRYARSLRPTQVRGVHFQLDSRRAQALEERWCQLTSDDIPLEVIDCPDRRLTRAALELTAKTVTADTEVTVLLPRRSYSPLLGRLLHDRTADRIAAQVSQVPHAAATIVPFDPGLPVRTGKRPQAAPVAGKDGSAARPKGGNGAADGGKAGPTGPSGEVGADGQPGRPGGKRRDGPASSPASRDGQRTGRDDQPTDRDDQPTDRDDQQAGAPAGEPSAGPEESESPEAGDVSAGASGEPATVTRLSDGAETHIAELQWRERARVRGRVDSVQVRPMSGAPVLECTLSDETGGLILRFYGRRQIPGINPGAAMSAEGLVSDYLGHLAMSNPRYTLLPTEGDDEQE